MIFLYRFSTKMGLRLSQLNFKNCRACSWSGLKGPFTYINGENNMDKQ